MRLREVRDARLDGRDLRLPGLGLKPAGPAARIRVLEFAKLRVDLWVGTFQAVDDELHHGAGRDRVADLEAEGNGRPHPEVPQGLLAGAERVRWRRLFGELEHAIEGGLNECVAFGWGTRFRSDEAEATWHL